MSDHLPEEAVFDEAAPVRASRWRIAICVAAAVGAGLYICGRLAATDPAGRFPSMFVILSTSMGPLLALLVFAGWWVLFGDGKRKQRILTVAASGVAAATAVIVADGSIRPMTFIWGLPAAAGITGLALAATPVAAWRPAVGSVLCLLALTPWWLLRLDGVTGEFIMDVSFRWTPSVRELADAQVGDRATTTASGPVSLSLTNGSASNAGRPVVDDRSFFIRLMKPLQPAASRPVSPVVEDWPGFRGAARTGVVSAESLQGWKGDQPPQERWRHGVGSVGVAWSSFCIVGNALFTQEQRRKSESVVCYRADTGEEVWARGEESLHSDAPSGAGPRATPAYANGFVYASTATGTVVCLKATTGEPVWRVSMEERFRATKPMYGVAASPLCLGDTVFINPASESAPKLVALDAATGATRWTTDAKGTDGYSSPHAATLHGVPQVLIFNGNGLSGHDPATGRELWNYSWKVAKTEPTTVQPLVLPDGRIVIGGGNIGLGIRCLSVQREDNAWSTKDVWQTTTFTPKFNDVVRRGDYLYGLDNGHLTCVSLSNGGIVWKEGEYGAGQLILAGDKLLVVSEKGKLACVAAKPDEYEELWKLDAVKGRTWNHPAVAHGRLYVRTMGEMVAYDLTLAGAVSPPAQK